MPHRLDIGCELQPEQAGRCRLHRALGPGVAWFAHRAQHPGRAIDDCAVNVSQPLRVALVGRIAAGEPISLPDDIAHHIDEDDYISLPPALLGNVDASEVFALAVRGDSMIDAMIQNGDIVILRRQQTAENGDMVAAWLPEDSETTLKHFYRRGDMIELHASQPSLSAAAGHARQLRDQRQGAVGDAQLRLSADTQFCFGAPAQDATPPAASHCS